MKYNNLLFKIIRPLTLLLISICFIWYLPDQNMWNPGIISKYQFYVSTDGVDWKMVDEGEFSSIKNNPLWQTKRFVPEQARFIRLRALKNMDGSNETGYAEIDVIAK